ncbi:MAG: ATP-dependent 6-phosphofructokinase [Proteobacteria bacterium]|nr:ATP-dependent 6-phosphofructokinase [Pseudomonadota bacterium]
MNNKFAIKSLGSQNFENPINLARAGAWTSDHELMAVKTNLAKLTEVIKSGESPEAFEIAGPRERIFFEPKDVRAGILTCGGLCPGLNTVIRSLVMQLWHRYGCRFIEGIRGGYQGLSAQRANDFFGLSPDAVEDIHMKGGTILGTSRGTPPTSEIVDTIVKKNLNMIFAIGGDGTLRGASAISAEIERRNLKISVIGIPKTIDNDIPWVRRSFGFETAVSTAVDAVSAAHVEAESVLNGVGLVKLMGRDSGYIAANATLASGDVNFCLVPEVDFNLIGDNGLIELLKKRLDARQHAVIVIAEGAGQKFIQQKPGYIEERDASGNIKLGDIGVFLRDEIRREFKRQGVPITVKYIDPSYIIRASAANSADQLFCARLAQNAVHAGMSGKTGLMIGYWHGRMTHVPFTSISERQRINPGGELWFNVLETTGQPVAIL